MLRKALTLLLLLLFLAESVVLASPLHENKERQGLPHQEFVAHEVSPTLHLVAEESEERDPHGDILLPFERDVLHPHLFPLISCGKISVQILAANSYSVLPLYQLHHTLII